MKRKESDFASPAVLHATQHLARLVRQARLARNWSQADLAERARISAPTMHRIEKSGVESSMGAWLSVLECLGLLGKITNISDAVSTAIIESTQAKRPRKNRADRDLDF